MYHIIINATVRYGNVTQSNSYYNYIVTINPLNLLDGHRLFDTNHTTQPITNPLHQIILTDTEILINRLAKIERRIRGTPTATSLNIEESLIIAGELHNNKITLTITEKIIELMIPTYNNGICRKTNKILLSDYTTITDFIYNATPMTYDEDV
jgi:hypothetical protein